LNINKLLIGYYGYWVKLTYLSIILAVVGMYFALGGNIGYAIICLMICGLCDMFDGPVARLSKRTAREENYGIQIDALADIISFGAFPVVIGYAAGPHYLSHNYVSFEMIASMGISAIYLLTALIRLAYFNVIEIELQNKDVKRTYYEGLPVTFVAIIIPLVYSVCLFFDISLSSIYNTMLFLISVTFVIKIKIPKLRGKQLFIFLLIGLPVIIYLFWNIRARI
jgi:CDP-diacylglycerol--serine O-phosphatidyltransferase